MTTIHHVKSQPAVKHPALPEAVQATGYVLAIFAATYVAGLILIALTSPLIPSMRDSLFPAAAAKLIFFLAAIFSLDFIKSFATPARAAGGAVCGMLTAIAFTANTAGNSPAGILLAGAIGALFGIAAGMGRK